MLSNRSLGNSNSLTSLNVFNELERQDNSEIFHKSIVALKNFFSRPVQLSSALEIYKIQRALMVITSVVKNQLQHLEKDWQIFLTQLHGKQCLIKDSYPTSINTSVAIEILNDQIPNADFQTLDILETENRQKFVNFLVEVDSFSFRTNQSSAFLNKMLEPQEARAYVAMHNNSILGGLWGFFAEPEDQKKVFHVWFIVVRPEYSSLKLGKGLLNFATQEICGNHPEVKAMTLNVDNFNKHAELLYKNNGFVPLYSAESGKTFMVRSLDSNSNLELSQETTINIAKDYAVKHARKVDLLYWVVVRLATSKLSETVWGYKNPPHEVFTFGEEL